MKMKNLFFACAATMAMLGFSGCSDDFNYNIGDGEGRLLLRTVVNSDVEVQKSKSRAAETDDALAESAIIWIANAKGVVREYNGVSAVPASGINLVSDNYVAMVWAGDSVPASFDSKYYRGSENFAIEKGSTVQVEVECKIANSVVEVKYDDAIDDVLTNYSMTVGHKAGKLTYNGREDENRSGYFMMPSYDKNLSYTLTGTKADGSEYTKSGVIENARPAVKYVLTVKHNDSSYNEFGGALFSIEVDETEILVEERIEMVAAPSISGLNFDLDETITGESGQLDEAKLWIQSSAKLKSVEINCPTFLDLLGIGGTEFEVFGMSDAIYSTLQSNGFTYQHVTHTDDAENPEFEEMKLVFHEALMKKIPNGEHQIIVTATDENNRSSKAVVNIFVSDASLRTNAIANDLDVYATHASVSGMILKEDLAGLGFNYRKQGTQQWSFIAANVSGSTMEAELENLSANTTYEYQALCDSFIGDTYTFTTEAATQLTNASFEDWCTGSDSADIPSASATDFFWDSGNHGSITMGTNITSKSTDYVHSGNYSIKMESQFVGVVGIGKFAAGNVFVGKYLKTDGTNGILGWGRPFTARPKALRVYVKYIPAAITDVDSKNPDGAKAGDMDKGMIYIALTDNSTVYDETTKESWPVIIRTRESKRLLFDKSGDNIIAYGEKVFTEATEGDGMVQIEIPLDYARTDVHPSNIVVVASASKLGDYFTGGPSVMYVDDFELVY
jgi:hypothetical protein